MMEKSLQMSCPTQNEYHEMARNQLFFNEIHLKWRTVSHLQVAFEILKLPVLDQKSCAIEGFQRVYLYRFWVTFWIQKVWQKQAKFPSLKV